MEKGYVQEKITDYTPDSQSRVEADLRQMNSVEMGQPSPFSLCQVRLMEYGQEIDRCFDQAECNRIGDVLDQVVTYLSGLEPEVVEVLKGLEISHAPTEGKGMVNETVAHYLQKSPEPKHVPRSLFSRHEDDNLEFHEWGRRR